MFEGSIIDELIATVTRVEEQELSGAGNVPEVSDNLLFLATLDSSDQTLFSGVA